MRVMVGVIILYDHVHPNGVFIKSSTIDVRREDGFSWNTDPIIPDFFFIIPPQIKSSLKVLKDQPADKVEGLLNALRLETICSH